ncbi:hypothetical protein CI102_9068 [Trichoderma harzianum]|uniref:Uncharacterized protein n=1 Tax=Trichoderma harzianum CBS 226.95 TaxID=983964 RepID=A0A2T4AKB4_TRIHA|nr:hypothetical protein M431DRAFT_2508 [Trichoderma harzianum CBS 226.95]PKK48609.1 hypothetical protein CI102_9068 [Trichoderma harzianum]PTB57378.1 hypothetical protein M431DRAFT_2508 [Trichoderma harzianum CBS 226.95]
MKQTLDDLLDSSIAADTKDDDGKSAIDYAKQTGLTWAIEKLKSALLNVPKARTEVEIQIRSLMPNQHKVSEGIRESANAGQINVSGTTAKAIATQK